MQRVWCCCKFASMTLSVSINEKSKEGKSVLAMLNLLAEKKTLTVIEEVQDKRMAQLIMAGHKSGLADTNRVMKKMGLGKLLLAS